MTEPIVVVIFPSGPLETNAILLGCPKTKKGAVVDPAFQSTSAILKKAEMLGLQIESIFLTHSHWDHIADAHALKEKTSALLFVHPLDAANVKHPGQDRIPLFFPIAPVKADRLIEEGDELRVGDLSFLVIHTPGHSPGGVCYYCKEHRLLLSGDTLFKGTIGSLHLPTAEEERMWTSLEKLSKLPPETRVIPGHGEETTIGAESWLSRAKQIFST